jgi:hypothetical protein
MPRQTRLDAPGTLHHVMGRGLERRAIFPDDPDRAAFLNRLAALADSGPSRSTPGPCSRITPTSWCGPGRTRCPRACARSSPRGAWGRQPPPPPRGPPLPEPGHVDRRGGRPLPPGTRALPPPAPAPGAGGDRPPRPRSLPLAARAAPALGVPRSALLGTARTRVAVRARQLVASVWVEHLGRRASELARVLGQSRGNVSLAAKRGTAHAAAWRAQIAAWRR